MAKKMKFGDGTTNFKRSNFSDHAGVAKGPLFSGTPAKEGGLDFLKTDFAKGDGVGDDIKTDSSGKKLFGEGKGVFKDDGGAKTEPTTNKREKEEVLKIEPIKIKEIATDTKEPELNKAVVPTPEEAEGIDPKDEVKVEKKSLWQKFQAHHDSGDAMKVEAHFKDAAAVIAGDGRADGTELHKLHAKNKQDKVNTQLKTDELAKNGAADEDNLANDIPFLSPQMIRVQVRNAIDGSWQEYWDNLPPKKTCRQTKHWFPKINRKFSTQAF